jgi:Putative auto-transporter adhesin, head GIN domain
MKKLLLGIATVIFVCISYAQRGPLKGSGKIVNKTFSFINFDKVNLRDLDGNVEIEVGKPFAISVAIDDNLEALLNVSIDDNGLDISLKGNKNNRMYIENTNIKIKISLPSLVYVLHDGNNGLTVNGITGDYFKIKCIDNGSATLSGAVNKLDIVCAGNGTVNAVKLAAKNIETTRSGNGNIFTSKEEVVDAENKEESNLKAKMIKVVIKNNTTAKVSLSVKYPISGSYGIGINANDSITESFPIGTKIYKGNQFTTFKKALFVIEENSADKPLTIIQ